MNRGLRGWFWQLVTYMQIICHPILAMEIKISIYANFLSKYFQGQLPLSKMADGKQVAGYLKEGSFPSFTVFPWKRRKRQAVFCSSLKNPLPHQVIDDLASFCICWKSVHWWRKRFGVWWSFTNYSATELAIFWPKDKYVLRYCRTWKLPAYQPQMWWGWSGFQANSWWWGRSRVAWEHRTGQATLLRCTFLEGVQQWLRCLISHVGSRLIFATYRMITSWYLRYLKYLRSWYLPRTTWSDRREQSQGAACPCNPPWRGSPLPEGSPEPIICNINQFLSWRLCYLHFTRFDNSNSPKYCPTGPQYPSPRRTRSRNNRSRRRCSKSNTEKKN